jgi:hypothetical protein
MRRLAAFNLPCFNQLYREYSDEFDFDFCEIYLKYSKGRRLTDSESYCS